jgi:Na+/proline symporter
MYEIVPGFICSSIAIYVVTMMNPQQEQEVLELFDEVEREFK